MEGDKSKLEIYGDMFTASKNANAWNDLYTAPANLFSHNMSVRRDRVCQFVFDNYKTDAKILDLGCGAGVVTEKLLENGYSVTGTDRSLDMLELSRKRMSRFPSERYSFHQGSCESLPFPDAQFDVILCVGVFGYIDDVVGALLEIRRALKPGGMLLISIRNPFNTNYGDPVKAVGRAGKNLLSAFRAKPAAPAATPAVAEVAGRPPQFRVDILQNPFPFIKGVTRCGYQLEEFTGFGFGPFRIAGKSLFNNPWQIKVSDFLNKAFDNVGLKVVTRTLGDVSIYTFRKTDNA